MTLLDTRGQILDYFCHATVFSKDEILGINVAKGFEPVKENLVTAAMAELEEEGFVTRIGDFLWILRQPLTFVPQTLQISTNTSIRIAEFINTCLDARGVEGDRCDPTNLREIDLLVFLNIFEGLLSADSSAQDGMN